MELQSLDWCYHWQGVFTMAKSMMRSVWEKGVSHCLWLPFSSPFVKQSERSRIYWLFLNNMYQLSTLVITASQQSLQNLDCMHHGTLRLHSQQPMGGAPTPCHTGTPSASNMSIFTMNQNHQTSRFMICRNTPSLDRPHPVSLSLSQRVRPQLLLLQSAGPEFLQNTLSLPQTLYQSCWVNTHKQNHIA